MSGREFEARGRNPEETGSMKILYRARLGPGPRRLQTLMKGREKGKGETSTRRPKERPISLLQKQALVTVLKA